MLNKLNPFSILLEGQHLVEASAGTGKTYNITSLFIRCILDREMDVDEILVLTYTKAATAELKERIMERIKESIMALKKEKAPEKDEFLLQLLEHIDQQDEAINQLDKALHNFDEASIFTIHSFCQRALQEQSFLSGIVFDTELITDDTELIQEVIDDWWRKLVERAEESKAERIWLNILQDEKYLPGQLADMVSPGLGKPYLQLACDQVNESREEELEELYELFKKLKQNWFGNESLIQELLLSDAMDGNRYRSSSVPGWIENMTDWLDNDLPSLNFIEKFDRFSIDFIRENGTRKGKEPPQHPFFYCVKAFIEQADRVRSWMPNFKKELIQHTREALRERKLESGALGYDDLLVMLQEALQRPQTGTELAEFLRGKFPVALVDEFQDTDPIQYNILEQIYPPGASGTALFLVGDPKQSIYSFRGADVFSYLNARANVSENRRYSLLRNFRSDPDLIEAVNKLFSRMEHPFWVEDIAFNPVKAADLEMGSFLIENQKPPLLEFLESTNLKSDKILNKSEARERAANLTAESIADILNKGEAGTVTIDGRPIKPKDIAILVRKHQQADLVREKLEDRGVNCVQYSEKSVFETDEARNLELLLKAVAEPRNDKLLQAVLATELFPYTAEDIIRFEEDEQAWTHKVEQFSGWNDIWQKHGFSSMLRHFLCDAAVEKNLITRHRGERKLTNTLQLGELLQAREQEQQGGMFELIKWLSHKRDKPDKNMEEEQLRLESDEDLVRIVTMHRSKGLEYPVVYCPFLWDGTSFSDYGMPFLYHDRANGHHASLDLNEKGSQDRQRHRLQSAVEELSESLRLAYVALTRAKHYCTIVYESARGMEFSPLGYLLLGKEKIKEQLEDKISSDKNVSNISSSEYRENLKIILSNYSNLFSHNKINDHEITQFHSDDQLLPDLKGNRTLTKRKAIHSHSVVSSFSSIMHPSADSDGEPMDDEFFLPDELHAPEEDEELSIFSFPKGPKAGTCVHTIFEDIDFSGLDHLDEAVEKNLNQFGFNQKWAPVLNDMVHNVVTKQLKPGVQLNKLGSRDQRKEMEFYFDLQPFKRQRLLQVVRGGDSYPDFEIEEGFMKGYIDLIFTIDDQFYIADYKTNYLGDSVTDYAPEVLEEEMKTAGYDIQYHIYTVALHRYLEKRVPDYSYAQHFGGVFYLFIRGMIGEAGQSGIFYHKPEESVIKKLDELFRAEVKDHA
ncbi:exodeoxyribonuclease V subunit beta [Aliifodinibius sp. S!AR15-10]|uniref:exodeoxyribonuclease V subunit beta n=1 Tax=Aliifodinibius sp. S!AR15-10 TaxID=2950437 RepID=UPI00286583A6|nr:exodeoxyribonuclease V subunit beta [Aliifodinibius sp. S!AR15-10]MDR8391586.1 exodeoxyribonuclease V subunit beta [Aliifodinibius sp. S!AR15-10]